MESPRGLSSLYLNHAIQRRSNLHPASLPKNPMNDMSEEDIIERLEKRIAYLESVLSEIQMLNAMGKTLKISEAITSAIDE